MNIKDHNGIEIDLDYDSDGFPLVNIDTGGGFYGEDQRPTVEVHLNGVLIHDMFTEGPDSRWEDGGKARRDALKLALAILEPFKEAGSMYIAYQDEEKFTDDQYDDMLDELRAMLADSPVDTEKRPG